MISVICCYNNKEMFQEFVVNSLCKQSSEYQLIGIDNTGKKYSSAAEAYNDAIKSAEGNILVFCHQDVEFPEANCLRVMEETISKNDNCILGFCGMFSDRIVRSNLKYKKDECYITRKQLTELKEAESVDECCFAISRNNLIKYGGFNCDICDGWHLYAVELCLRIKRKGGRVLVSPMTLFHKYDNTIGLETDNNFLRVMRRIAKTYKSKGGDTISMLYLSNKSNWTGNKNRTFVYSQHN